MKKFTFGIALFLFFLSFMVFSYSNVYDLSELKPGKSEINFVNSKEEIKIIFKNLIPNIGDNYIITERISQIILEPMDINNYKKEGGTDCEQQNNGILKTICSTLENLLSCQTENDVKNKLGILFKEKKELWKSKKIDTQTKEFWDEKINKAIKSTIYKNNPVSLKGGQQYEITIRNQQNKNEIWKFIFKTNYSRIVPIFGMSFIENFIIAKEETFFTKNTDSGFLVSKMNNEKTAFYIPTIFFIKELAQPNHSNKLDFSFTAGLGLTDKTPFVFAGLAWMYHRTIGFSLGVALHNRYVLKGIYEYEEVEDNDSGIVTIKKQSVLKENLDFSQLHETDLRLGFYFSIIINISENFIKKKKD